MGRPRLPIVVTPELRRRYESGELTANALGAALGCDFTTVRNRLLELGVAVRTRAEAHAIRSGRSNANHLSRLKQVAAMKEAGETYSGIGRKLGFSRQRASQLCQLARNRGFLEE